MADPAEPLAGHYDEIVWLNRGKQRADRAPAEDLLP
jgi:hypothetical protein